DWSAIRGQVLGYFFLLLIMVVYKGHSEEMGRMADMDTAPTGRHIHCCCEEFYGLAEIEQLKDQFLPSDVTKSFIFMALILIGGLSPLWERFIGRRKMLMVLMI
ncbi:hypothetical protein PENTCL1PPCAC_5582, partial [Pristionchus entomophagus]